MSRALVACSSLLAALSCSPRRPPARGEPIATDAESPRVGAAATSVVPGADAAPLGTEIAAPAPDRDASSRPGWFGEPSGSVAATHLAAAGNHTCVGLADRSVRCWGQAQFREFGNDQADDVLPKRLAGLAGAREVIVGESSVCILTDAGSVECQGVDRREQGNVSHRFAFRNRRYRGALFAVANVVLIATDGVAYCLGDNGYGECGPGAPWGFVMHKSDLQFAMNAVARWVSAPVPLSDQPVRAIGLGSSHGCRVDRDSLVRCWGRNDQLQLGSPDRIDGPQSLVVPDIVGATQLALGDAHSCALVPPGRVACWGDNSQKQLGDATLHESAIPLWIAGLNDAVQLTSGRDTICAVRPGGGVTCWGGGLLPHPLDSLPPVQEVAIGDHHVCVRSANGAVACWGKNDHLQLGTTAVMPRSDVPVGVHWN